MKRFQEFKPLCATHSLILSATAVHQKKKRKRTTRLSAAFHLKKKKEILSIEIISAYSFQGTNTKTLANATYTKEG